MGKVKSEGNIGDLGTKHWDLPLILELVEMAGSKFDEVKRAVLRGLAAVTLLAQPVGATTPEAEAEEDDVYNFVKFYLVCVVAIWLIGSLVLSGSSRLGHWLQLHFAAGNPAGPLPSLPATAVIGVGPTDRNQGGAAVAAPTAVPVQVQAPVEVRGSGSLPGSSTEWINGAGSAAAAAYLRIQEGASSAAAAAADEEREPVEVAPALRIQQSTYGVSLEEQPVGLGVRRRGLVAMSSAAASASTRAIRTRPE